MFVVSSVGIKRVDCCFVAVLLVVLVLFSLECSSVILFLAILNPCSAE